jgi:hypothetical protein
MSFVSTDRRFVAACFVVALVAAVVVWAVGLNEWQAWLTAAILAVGLCMLYTIRVILPHARSRDPRGPRERREHPQPVHR